MIIGALARRSRSMKLWVAIVVAAYAFGGPGVAFRILAVEGSAATRDVIAASAKRVGVPDRKWRKDGQRRASGPFLARNKDFPCAIGTGLPNPTRLRRQLMRVRDTASLFVCAILATACASGGASSGTGASSEAAAAASGPALTAILSPANGSRVSGEVTLRPDSRPGRMSAKITISGGAANTEHPWQIKRGQCGDMGAVEIAPLAAYRTLRTRGDGAGRFEGSVNVPLPEATGALHVEVLRSRSSNIAVACGMLSPVP